MLRALPVVSHPDLLIGSTSGDDAAVWRLDDHKALVFTADIITPVVDDARTWGAIAATNAVSDVYAMGGTPVCALSLVGWNDTELPLELLTDALTGVADVAARSGFVVVGGHTITDPEPKLGLAVVGFAAPGDLLTNAGLRPRQLLVLTKPLGVGVITTALKRGGIEAGGPELAAAVAAMTTTNEQGARVAKAAGATGATDVTGFGLCGHLGRMALESGVAVRVDTGGLALLPGARELCAAGYSPGGATRNLDGVAGRLDGSVDEVTLRLVADPQTSGGLLFGVDPDRAGEALTELHRAGLDAAAVIGEVIEGPAGRIMLA